MPPIISSERFSALVSASKPLRIAVLGDLMLDTYISGSASRLSQEAPVPVLRVREKLKTGKKLEKYEREFLRRNRDLVLLPSRCSTAEQEILKDWTERKNL